tara:strand:- start:298141 stop:299475 length:1335 start_codon:yes stop_codon:yes gene_type:complete
VLKTFAWTVTGHFAGQFFRLLSNLILTRLLAPELFGIMAMVYIFIMGIHMFSDVGLAQNVVSSKNSHDRKFLSTIWVIQIIRGFLIFAFSIPLAFALYYGQISGMFDPNTVYNYAELPYLVVAVSISSIISGFNSINILVLSKKLTIGKVVTLDLLCQLLGLVFLIILVWFWRDIWALVIGNIFTVALKMVLSHHSNFGPRYNLSWHRKSAHEIIHFGKWIFASTILGFALGQGDRILLSIWLSPAELGVYSIAFLLGAAFKLIMQKVANSVFYPMLSEINKDQPAQLSIIYYKIRSKIDITSAAVAGFIASLGSVIVTLLYDDRYIDAGWMLEILSLSILFSGYSIAGTIFLAKGKSKALALLTLITTIGLYISVPILYNLYGLKGALYAISLNYIFDLPAIFYMLNKHKILNVTKEFCYLPIFFVTYGLGYLLESVLSDWIY